MSTLGLTSIAPETVVTGELTLADVLARRVTVEWFEAVAVVRAITEELGRSSDHPSTPDLGQIWLGQDGVVRLSGVSYEDEPVRRLGQLLQALLNQADPPVTLRLIAGNATAPVPIYTGLREFDDAVAYFERPNRLGVLRGLLARAEAYAAGDPAASQALRSLDDVAPLPARRATRRPIVAKSLRRIVTGVLIAIVTIGAAFLLVRSYRQGERLPVARLTTTAQQATDAVSAVMLSGISAVTERIGMGSLVAHAESVSVAVPLVDLKRPKRAASLRGRSFAKDAGTIQAFDLDNEVAMTLPPAVSAVSPAPSAGRAAPAAAPAVAAGAVDPSVYSPEFPNVVPPTAIRPQLPRVLPEGVPAANLSRIEVLVQRDGTVESVKLVQGSRPTVKDGMLLSAAKTWRFAPATKDGAPVRYRKTIWIITE